MSGVMRKNEMKYLLRRSMNRKILSSNPFHFTTVFTTNRLYKLTKFCSDLPQSVNPRAFDEHPETFVKQVWVRKNKEI